MGKLTHFRIMFDDDKEIYHPGEVVEGRVKIKLNASMQMKGVRIIFCGKAHVQWDEGSDDRKSCYSATQMFFNKEIYVYGTGDPRVTNHVELDEGEHVYRFSFPLPLPLPSSYEDSFGFVRYHVKSSIVKPWKFDHNTKQAFTVLDTLDLNTLPSGLTSSGASVSKNICCMCCRSGPVELDFYVDRTGYVPGEYITINANIVNASDRVIERTSAEILRHVTYHAQGGEKMDMRPIKKKMGSGCQPNSTLNWRDEKMQIPPLPPTELPHCNIIDVEYVVQFTVHVTACSENLRGQAPIIIGTVPIRTLPGYRNGSSGQCGIGSSGRAVTPPPSFSSLPPSDLDVKYNNLPPPPSYAAVTEGSSSIMESDDNEFTMGEMSYTPHYIYYDWNRTDTPT